MAIYMALNSIAGLYDYATLQNQVDSQMTKKHGSQNVSVLVYTRNRIFKDGLRDLMFEGNFRKECKLKFDCIFKQKFKYHVTANLFNSMDAVVVGDDALKHLRDDLLKIYGKVTVNSRKRDQIWVAYSEEASVNVHSTGHFERDTTLDQMFNWTIFQSKNATIQKKFFYIYEKSKHDIYSQSVLGDNTYRKKSKDFCWIISNCDNVFSQNRFKIAENLIGSLSSKVHIWGNAIKRTCVNGKHENVVDHGPINGLHSNYYDEAQKHIQDCKFYFAFENSNCSDYVTEKFLNSIAVGAIPIVNGWWGTYEEQLPGSYIHVNEFANSPQLAEYLERLLKDETMANKYQEWRKFYRYERTGVKTACQLCHKLEKFKSAQLAGEPWKPTIIPSMAERYKTLQKCAS
ncbi:4-galactosyl-N-acetylglucosaminide 3-alpha-L-fucosyltransferase 9-like isoform X2 [Convolutriloba macropyga]|uniref:4-galactosyl-N-acetylglucosaminide 3-alpha-L-fucosyltransferase 9-like isoform X2 n=1 Tax=Convolutriloba macropyga TaxID=536237 RepID=UPI003F51F3EC